MNQVVCPKRTTETSGGSTPTRSTTTTLPPDLLEKASVRLVWTAVIAAVSMASMFLINVWLRPGKNPVVESPILRLHVIGLILLSLVYIAVHKSGRFSPQWILRLGLGFQILIGFILASFEYLLPQSFDPTHYHGVSWLTVWVIICGLLVPNRAWITITTLMLTAAMGPVAYFVNMVTTECPALPPGELFLQMFPTFLMAGWTAFLNQRLYKLEADASRAKDLGSYHLVHQIGKGGMGEVWYARHRMLARRAAVKLIRPEVLEAQTGRQASILRRRFEQEARATASLSSPNTVELYDFGVAEDGVFYYVMELLEGLDLETLVKRFGPVEPARVKSFLLQACESLEEAHRLGMVHRDIKPTNLFTCRLGLRFDHIKVLDFGLVRTEPGGTQTRMTLDGTATGTPAFMAPEIATGAEEFDGRVDLYGLGCVAYYLLTGQLVFEEKNPMAMALAHLQKKPKRPSERTELPIPKSLEDVIMACLEKDPQDRPHSAQEITRRLEAGTDVRAWTREDAARWWQIHLPDGAAHQTAEQGEPAQPSPVRAL
jgi:eukaryotic-like serine/threonine-protein kinase